MEQEKQQLFICLLEYISQQMAMLKVKLNFVFLIIKSLFLVYGKYLSRDMDEIRKSLGLC